MPLISALLALIVVVAGCSETPPLPALPFAAATEAAARERVSSFLEAYRARDVERALAHLCRQDGAERAFLERSLEPGSPFAIASYDVERPVPLWDGGEPLFSVAVRFPRRSREGSVVHEYRVRAREGCLEGLLPSLEQRAPPPAHAPPGDDDVIEL